MNKNHEIGVGLLGLGVVGTGVAQAILQKEKEIAGQVGSSLVLRGVLVKRLTKTRSPLIPGELLTTDPERILGDPSVSVIVEVMGGEHPALEFIRGAILQGKNVVTANKEVMAKHGFDILALAAKKRVEVLFEASVGGGIPIVGPLRRDLLGNQISSIHAIINGTTNYLLTRMTKDGLDFNTALEEARTLGYAETNPANDIEGTDAAYKLAILATLAFHTKVGPEDVYHEGVSCLQPRDFRYAQELGYAIKLLAIAKRDGDGLQLRVHPTFVPADHLMAKVDGAFNAIEVEGDLVGTVTFHGLGAGPKPTASAVIGDLIEIGRSIAQGVRPFRPLVLDSSLSLKPVSQVETCYYMRMIVADRPGVLAQISRILGDRDISIASVIQKESNEAVQAAEIVIMTHSSREANVQEALRELRQLPVVKGIGNFLRVEH